MASVETQIKNYVIEAQRQISRKAEGVTFSGSGSHENVVVAIESGHGEITVKMVPHTSFTKSFYRVDHPALGRFQGLLNGPSARMGEYGINPGKPSKL